MNHRDLLQPANLLSLSRIALAPIVGYFLWVDTVAGTTIAALLLILAGITDGLDGYLARRLNQVTPLGIALDPLADKLFAIILAGCLILYRAFPLWLAVAIVARDLLILAGGLSLKKDRELNLPSNLTGKWTFAAIAVLLGAYVIRFQFSIALMTPVVVVMLLASLISYGLVYLRLRANRPVEPFRDNRWWRTFRYGLLAAVTAAHAVMFYVEFIRSAG